MAPLLTAPYKLDSYVDKTTITLVGTPTIKRRQGTTEAGQLGVVIQLTVALSILLCPKTKSTMVFPRGIWHLQNPAIMYCHIINLKKGFTYIIDAESKVRSRRNCHLMKKVGKEVLQRKWCFLSAFSLVAHEKMNFAHHIFYDWSNDLIIIFLILIFICWNWQLAISNNFFFYLKEKKRNGGRGGVQYKGEGR